MTYQTIVYERVEERIARITLNRPEKLNAMSPALLGEFDEALGEFERDSDASILVIRGAGRSFCAGYDLTAGAEGGRYTITEDRWAMRRLVERWQRLWNSPKPTIAQVHGHCLAGATELDPFPQGQPLAFEAQRPAIAITGKLNGDLVVLGRRLAQVDADL